MKFTITITRDEDGMYIAECPAIPGCVSQGKTEEEAEANVQDAIKQCLEVRAENGDAANCPHAPSGSYHIMPPVPLLPPSDVIRMFQHLGWQIVRQKGSHIIMTKPGRSTRLSNTASHVHSSSPNHMMRFLREAS